MGKLSNNLHGLHLLSERDQINIPEQVCPKYKRVLYKVYSAVGYIVKVVDANNGTRDPSEVEMTSPNSSPIKLTAGPDAHCAVTKVK